MQDWIPFIIVGVFLGLVVYSTIKNRRNFVDEQMSMDKLYEHDSVLSLAELKVELETLASSDDIKDTADIKRCLSLMNSIEDVDSAEAKQLNQRIASAIRTLKHAIVGRDKEQVNYSVQYLEILLEQRSHLKPEK